MPYVACTSSCKCSGMRHISNLHEGLGNIVSFIDYAPNPNYLLKQSPTAAPRTSINVMKDDTSSLFQKTPDGQFSDTAEDIGETYDERS